MITRRARRRAAVPGRAGRRRGRLAAREPAAPAKSNPCSWSRCPDARQARICVRAGQPLITLHTDTPERFARAREALADAREISDAVLEERPLILGRPTDLRRPEGLAAGRWAAAPRCRRYE